MNLANKVFSSRNSRGYVRGGRLAINIKDIHVPATLEDSQISYVIVFALKFWLGIPSENIQNVYAKPTNSF